MMTFGLERIRNLSSVVVLLLTFFVVILLGASTSEASQEGGVEICLFEILICLMFGMCI